MAGIATANVLRASQANIPEPVAIVAAEDTTLTIALPFGLGAESAVLTLARADGATIAAPIPTPVALAGSPTYELATIADSALAGPGTRANLAMNPADGSYALHYSRWADDPASRRYYSLQGGAWAREDVPSALPIPLGRNLAIDKSGVARLVGTSTFGLTYYSRPPGPAGQWAMDMLEPDAMLDDAVVQVDTTANVPQVVYGKYEQYYHRLLWTHCVNGEWMVPQYIEAWCDVDAFDFAIAPDGSQHVAYARHPDSAQYPEIIYAWRSENSGAWTYVRTGYFGYDLQSLSIGFDGVGNTPVIAFIDYAEMDTCGLRRRAIVVYKTPFFWMWEPLDGTLYTPWLVRVRTTPAGRTHLAYYEAGDEWAPNGGPGRVVHVERESEGFRLFRPWYRDTVVESGDERLGVGEVVPPFDMRLASDEPAIMFGLFKSGISPTPGPLLNARLLAR